MIIPKDLLERFKNAFLKMKEIIRFKQIIACEARLRQIQAIIALIAMLALFVAGYKVLYTVDPVLCRWLLSCNLIVVANVMLFKMR